MARLLNKALGLSPDGRRVLQMLMIHYGMTEANALKLMKDGGAPLAVALLAIAR